MKKKFLLMEEVSINDYDQPLCLVAIHLFNGSAFQSLATVYVQNKAKKEVQTRICLHFEVNLVSTIYQDNRYLFCIVFFLISAKCAKLPNIS